MDLQFDPQYMGAGSKEGVVSDRDSGANTKGGTQTANSTSVSQPPGKDGSWTARVTIDTGSSIGGAAASIRVGSISNLLGRS